jgi:hypothetical protein
MERDRDRPVPTWAAALLAAAGLFLVPWVVVLNLTLPSEKVADHWAITWTGFDLLLACSLLFTAYAAARRRDVLQRVAPISGTLLVCDAWFDVLTASSSADATIAILLAALGELPLAAVCFLLATDGLRPDALRKPRALARRLRLP